jgi:hypothetical protein
MTETLAKLEARDVAKRNDQGGDARGGESAATEGGGAAQDGEGHLEKLSAAATRLLFDEKLPKP